ncbi:hypothetical protein HDV63DRAFT_156151 [Trichoderma sp. SZMC 28014]
MMKTMQHEKPLLFPFPLYNSISLSLLCPPLTRMDHLRGRTTKFMCLLATACFCYLDFFHFLIPINHRGEEACLADCFFPFFFSSTGSPKWLFVSALSWIKHNLMGSVFKEKSKKEERNEKGAKKKNEIDDLFVCGIRRLDKLANIYIYLSIYLLPFS